MNSKVYTEEQDVKGKERINKITSIHSYTYYDFSPHISVLLTVENSVTATATNATTALSVLAVLVQMAPQQLSVASCLLNQLSANLINTVLKQLLVLESCEYCSFSYTNVSGTAIVGMFSKCSLAQNKPMLATTCFSVLVGHNTYSKVSNVTLCFYSN